MSQKKCSKKHMIVRLVIDMAKQLRTLKDIQNYVHNSKHPIIGDHAELVRDEARKWVEKLRGDNLKLTSKAELEMDKQFLNMKFDYCIHWIQHFFNLEDEQ